MCVLGRSPVLSQTCALKLSYMKIPMAQLGREPIPTIAQMIVPCLGATECHDINGNNYSVRPRVKVRPVCRVALSW